MRGEVAELWRTLTEQEKIAHLRIWASYDMSIDADFLDEDPDVLDALGESLGLVKVWCTKVDVAGMRDYSPGLVPPGIASQYRKRV